MIDEIFTFIKENDLYPFSIEKPNKKNTESIYKTSDAKSIHNKIISKINSTCTFSSTSRLLDLLDFTNSFKTIKSRQVFIKTIQPNLEKSFLKKLKQPKPNWRPPYGIIIVTEDESTFMELKKRNIPTHLLHSVRSIEELDSYEVVQAVN